MKDEAEAQVEQTNRALQRLSEAAPGEPRVAPPAGKDGTSNLVPAKAGTTGTTATGSGEPAKESAEATVEALVVRPDGRPVAEAEVQTYAASRTVKPYRTDARGAFASLANG